MENAYAGAMGALLIAVVLVGSNQPWWALGFGIVGLLLGAWGTILEVANVDSYEEWRERWH